MSQSRDSTELSEDLGCSLGFCPSILVLPWVLPLAGEHRLTNTAFQLRGRKKERRKGQADKLSLNIVKNCIRTLYRIAHIILICNPMAKTYGKTGQCGPAGR